MSSRVAVIVQALFALLPAASAIAGVDDIVALLRANTEIAAINAAHMAARAGG